MTQRNQISLEAIERLRTARRVAAITGAGISSESGIPTFRGAGGLWRNFHAEELATPEAFGRDPGLVWEWYHWRRELCSQANPNAAHRALVEMESTFEEFLLITQNVDDLHRRAGSEALIEVHGNIFRARCTGCSHKFALPFENEDRGVPLCARCGAIARPDIVWFGESYDQNLLGRAIDVLTDAEVVITIGTSGMVYIPVFLAEQAMRAGAYCIDINPEESQISEIAHLSIRAPAGEVLPHLMTAFASPTEKT